MIPTHTFVLFLVTEWLLSWKNDNVVTRIHGVGAKYLLLKCSFWGVIHRSSNIVLIRKASRVIEGDVYNLTRLQDIRLLCCCFVTVQECKMFHVTAPDVTWADHDVIKAPPLDSPGWWRPPHTTAERSWGWNLKPVMRDAWMRRLLR